MYRILSVYDSIMTKDFLEENSAYHWKLHSYTARAGSRELDCVQIRIFKSLGPHTDFKCGQVEAEVSTTVTEFNGRRDGRGCQD